MQRVENKHWADDIKNVHSMCDGGGGGREESRQRSLNIDQGVSKPGPGASCDPRGQRSLHYPFGAILGRGTKT